MGANAWVSLAVAAVCLVMLVRLAVGERRRARLDRTAIRTWQRLRAQALHLWQWRRRRQTAAQAALTAQDVIERARRARPSVDKDGNVYRPEAFKGPRKPH